MKTASSHSNGALISALAISFMLLTPAMSRGDDKKPDTTPKESVQFNFTKVENTYTPQHVSPPKPTIKPPIVHPTVSTIKVH